MPTTMSPQRQFRKNIVPVTLLTATYQVVFDMPLKDNDYEVYYQASLNTGFGAINKTTTGFTMVLGVAVAGNITTYAVANNL